MQNCSGKIPEFFRNIPGIFRNLSENRPIGSINDVTLFTNFLTGWYHSEHCLLRIFTWVIDRVTFKRQKSKKCLRSMSFFDLVFLWIIVSRLLWLKNSVDLVAWMRLSFHWLLKPRGYCHKKTKSKNKLKLLSTVCSDKHHIKLPSSMPEVAPSESSPLIYCSPRV